MKVERSLNEVIDRIVEVNHRIADFWSDGGWAQGEAAQLLARSRLDRQVSLSRCLRKLVHEAPRDEAEGWLILAWTALGSLVEGTMKFFLSVHLGDYDNNPMLDRQNNVMPPDEMMLEVLKQFFSRVVWAADQRIRFRLLVETIQQRRNSIHTYKDRQIGDVHELRRCIGKYLDFLEDMHGQIPYP
jgi:hypothetical protein